MTTDYSQYYKDADANASIQGRNAIKSGKPFWTPPTGGDKWKVSRVRILPPPASKSDDMFYTWVPLHNLPGVNYPVLCPSKHGSEYCPACEISQSKRAQGDKDGAIRWSPSWRALVNVVVLSVDGKHFLDKDGSVVDEPIPYLWGIPKRTNDDLQQKIEQLGETNPGDPKVLNITHPRYGRDVFVRRQGKEDRTRYEVELAQSPSPMPAAMFPALEKMHGLEIEEVYDRVTAAQMKPMLVPPSARQTHDPLEEEPEEDFVDAQFKELPAPDDIPFADDDAPGEFAEEPEENPFADDEENTPEPTPAAAPAASRVSAARQKLLEKVKK